MRNIILIALVMGLSSLASAQNFQFYHFTNDNGDEIRGHSLQLDDGFTLYRFHEYGGYHPYQPYSEKTYWGNSLRSGPVTLFHFHNDEGDSFRGTVLDFGNDDE